MKHVQKKAGWARGLWNGLQHKCFSPTAGDDDEKGWNAIISLTDQWPVQEIIHFTKKVNFMTAIFATENIGQSCVVGQKTKHFCIGTLY